MFINFSLITNTVLNLTKAYCLQKAELFNQNTVSVQSPCVIVLSCRSFLKSFFKC